jgi:hypothetical protein
MKRKKFYKRWIVLSSRLLPLFKTKMREDQRWIGFSEADVNTMEISRKNADIRRRSRLSNALRTTRSTN